MSGVWAVTAGSRQRTFRTWPHACDGLEGMLTAAWDIFHAPELDNARVALRYYRQTYRSVPTYKRSAFIHNMVSFTNDSQISLSIVWEVS